MSVIRPARHLFLPLLAVLMFALPGSAGAKGPELGKEKVYGPYYNPETKSYIALVQRRYIDGSWGYNKALADAQRRTHKGVHGRLAIIRNREAHDWIVETFGDTMIRKALIGLRYYCNNDMLMWIDGTVHERTEFAPWQIPWYLTYDCSSVPRPYWMGVYYEPPNLESKTRGRIRAMRWRAASWAKGFLAYLVEFPTGEP